MFLDNSPCVFPGLPGCMAAMAPIALSMAQPVSQGLPGVKLTYSLTGNWVALRCHIFQGLRAVLKIGKVEKVKTPTIVFHETLNIMELDGK